jgi:D-glycero-beta-D-manno-heptose-7-phosphate kinase
MTGTEFDKLFNDFFSIKIGVIGDVMLDTYWWGHVERISPEAPVPVVTLDSSEYRIGGAGNVALNLVSLGAKASILSVVGEDEDGQRLASLFKEKGISVDYLQTSASRITTNKTRVISRNQQMMRLDKEISRDLSTEEETALLSKVKEYLAKEKPQIVIFEDYNKGVLTDSLIGKVIELCKESGVFTSVDPKKKNFFSFKGVDIFKPNLKEVKEGLNVQISEVNSKTLQSIHQQLHLQLSHKISFITLSEHGVFFQYDHQSKLIPSHMRSIADVSGAGDTVIAVASLVYASTRKMELAAAIANIAGGLVCEEVGTVAINKERLLSECQLLLSTTGS